MIGTRADPACIVPQRGRAGWMPYQAPMATYLYFRKVPVEVVELLRNRLAAIRDRPIMSLIDPERPVDVEGF